MSGTDIISFAVEQGMFESASLGRLSFGKISTSRLKAQAEIIANGAPIPTRYQFRKEDSLWKFDLVYLTAVTRPIMKFSFEKAAKDMSIGVEEFLFQMISGASGRPIIKDLWAPLE